MSWLLPLHLLFIQENYFSGIFPTFQSIPNLWQVKFLRELPQLCFFELRIKITCTIELISFCLYLLLGFGEISSTQNITLQPGISLQKQCPLIKILVLHQQLRGVKWAYYKKPTNKQYVMNFPLFQLSLLNLNLAQTSLKIRERREIKGGKAL